MTSLGRRTLGRTGLTVSEMGLGSGGPSRLGQRRGTSVREVRTLLRTAFDLGINTIDTARDYGDSEALLGEALVGTDRDDLIISTKFSPYDPDGQILPADALRTSLEQSLRLLRTDRLDVFYLHAVHADTTGDVMDVFAEPLQTAIDDGLVRFSGLSEAYWADHGHESVRAAITDHDLDVVMVGYNLMSPLAATTVFPLATERNVGVVIMCAIRGVIADPAKLTAVVRNWKRAGLLDEDDVPDEAPLDWLLGHADSIAAAAYKFAAAPAAVGCVLTGTASPSHLTDNVAAVTGAPLPGALMERLHAVFAKVGRNVGPADVTG